MYFQCSQSIMGNPDKCLAQPLQFGALLKIIKQKGKIRNTKMHIQHRMKIQDFLN